MSQLVAIARRILGNIDLFSRLVLRVPLRQYQLQPLQAVLDSVLNRRGLDFLLVFPRQSGKNELVAHLMVYLLNVMQRVGGNLVFGAVGDGPGRMLRRLEARLDNAWNAGRWGRGSHPLRRTLGKAAAVFVSSHPQAAARGETAHWLLVIDELQDQDAAHLEAVFEPMRAAYNATALYIGTVKLTSDALWQKKRELEQLQAADGIQRVFMVTPDQVTEENPAYADFLAKKVRQFGRHHPIIASEYFLEPIDGSGGLFDGRRRTLMHGQHPRQTTLRPGQFTIATLDLAGQDEATTDPTAQLANPGRDYTVATVFEVLPPAPGVPLQLPSYHALDVWVDHGSRHFQETPGRPPLVQRLLAWLEHWQVNHLIADQAGVGQGVVDWFSAALGRERVTGFDLGGSGKKAALGAAFLSIVETGRFHYWTGDEDQPLSEGWWFWQQVEHCNYHLPPDGSLERHLQWSVPTSLRVSTPAGPQLVHDDRLLSAALIAHADQLSQQGKLGFGAAASVVIPPPTDPAFEENDL